MFFDLVKMFLYSGYEIIRTLLVRRVVREEDRITDTDIANVRPPQLSKENADTENVRSS